MSSTLHAQARARAPTSLDGAKAGELPDTSGFKEAGEAHPCPRWSMEDRYAHKWWNTAWNTICIERARSEAVALAWAQGVDEHGVQLDLEARAGKLREMEAWLRLLAGTFRIEGKRWNAGGGGAQVLGSADCFAIGSGPGVSCLISAVWDTNKDSGKQERTARASYFAVRPQVLLFGLDPGKMEIRLTHVDDLAVGMSGFLIDGAVVLNAQAPPEVITLSGSVTGSTSNPFSRIAPQSAGRAVPKPLSRVALTPGGDVDMKLHVYPPDLVTLWNQPIEFDLRLHRELPVDAATPGGTP
jgi:hypothetical protein